MKFQIAATSRPTRRRALSQCLIYFLGCSMLGMCTSEAYLSSPNAFLPRGLKTRGGADAVRRKTTNTMKMEFHDGLNFNGDSQSEVTLDVVSSLNGNTNGSGKVNGLKINGKKVNGKKVNGLANGMVNGKVNGFVNGVVSQEVRDNVNINAKSFDKKRVINGDDEDQQVPATFIADTKLPTIFGQYRLRAYRFENTSNEFTGNEPCVIYSEDNPPIGKEGEFLESVPIRIHDQCLTSEVFGSQR